MKGISAIIATIVLLLITIALAGTAYMYISGYFGRQIAVQLEPVPGAESCGTDTSVNNVAIYIRNIGTETLDATGVDRKITIIKDGGTEAEGGGIGFAGDLEPGKPVKYTSKCTDNVCNYQFIPTTAGQGTLVSIFCPV